ncbi:MAG: ABC transporter ATP-binding protein [Eubacteriales bacterium]
MLIELKDALKTYIGTPGNNMDALKDVNLEIAKGEFIAVTGKSGAGKSTLLNIIGCIDTLSSGSYILDGKNISEFKDTGLSKIRNGYFGFIMQDFALINEMTTAENIYIPTLFNKMNHKSATYRVIQMLDAVGLGEYYNKRVKYLSGGERQRVAIARSLINDPDIILADEPTGNLDSATSDDIIDILKGLNSEGKTVIIITHNHDIAALCSRIIVMSNGRIISDENKY